MGYAILRSPRRSFASRYSVFPLLAEWTAKRDIFAAARDKHRDAVARVMRTR